MKLRILPFSIVKCIKVLKKIKIILEKKTQQNKIKENENLELACIDGVLQNKTKTTSNQTIQKSL